MVLIGRDFMNKYCKVEYNNRTFKINEELRIKTGNGKNTLNIEV